MLKYGFPVLLICNWARGCWGAWVADRSCLYSHSSVGLQPHPQDTNPGLMHWIALNTILAPGGEVCLSVLKKKRTVPTIAEPADDGTPLCKQGLKPVQAVCRERVELQTELKEEWEKHWSGWHLGSIHQHLLQVCTSLTCATQQAEP